MHNTLGNSNSGQRCGVLRWSALFCLTAFPLQPVCGQIPGAAAAAVSDPLPTPVEARARARLLHETIEGTLQVVHRDLFRKDESLAIPSRSFEDVFAELQKRHGVELQWLAVDTKAMALDHEADDRFEREAVEALQKGAAEFEAGEPELFQYAAPIRLSTQCLSCHAPLRTSNDERRAALVIRMPVREH